MAAKKKIPLAEPVTAASYNDRFGIRVGSGLTPQLISSTQRLADLGQMHQWSDLLAEARAADPHMHGELAKREGRVAAAPIEMRPADSTRKAKKAAEYCNDLIDNFEVPRGSLAVSFRDGLKQLLTGNYQGRAGLEAVWKRDGRALRPTSLYPIHPRRLAYSTHDWRLCVWDATVGDTPFAAFPGVPCDDAEVFPDGKLVVHTPRIFADYPTREGLGRCLIWYAGFKRWDVRDWVAFAAWAGRGMRVGKYGTGRDQKRAQAEPEDIQVLKDALAAMSSSVSTVLADTTDFDLIPAPTNQEVHERLCTLCNNEISKAVNGGTLSADPGERGARSLGEVMERAALMIAGTDARGVGETCRRDLFGPAVRERYGDGCPVPLVAIITEPRESQDSLVNRVVKVATAGLKVPAGWLRDQMAMPEPKGDEETIGGAPAPAAHADGTTKPGAKPGDAKKPDEPDADDEADDEADDDE